MAVRKQKLESADLKSLSPLSVLPLNQIQELLRAAQSIPTLDTYKSLCRAQKPKGGQCRPLSLPHFARHAPQPTWQGQEQQAKDRFSSIYQEPRSTSCAPCFISTLVVLLPATDSLFPFCQGGLLFSLCLRGWRKMSFS